MPTDADFDYASSSVPPNALFVAADEPLLVYPSVAAAERHLEALDVRNGVYPAAYSSSGEPYSIRSDSDVVRIERTGASKRPEELKSLLLQYLRATGHPHVPAATLDDLVATVWAIESEFWQEHDPYGERFATRSSLLGCIGFLMLMAAIVTVAILST